MPTPPLKPQTPPAAATPPPANGNASRSAHPQTPTQPVVNSTTAAPAPATVQTQTRSAVQEHPTTIMGSTSSRNTVAIPNPGESISKEINSYSSVAEEEQAIRNNIRIVNEVVTELLTKYKKSNIPFEKWGVYATIKHQLDDPTLEKYIRDGGTRVSGDSDAFKLIPALDLIFSGRIKLDDGQSRTHFKEFVEKSHELYFFNPKVYGPIIANEHERHVNATDANNADVRGISDTAYNFLMTPCNPQNQRSQQLGNRSLQEVLNGAAEALNQRKIELSHAQLSALENLLITSQLYDSQHHRMISLGDDVHDRYTLYAGKFTTSNEVHNKGEKDNLRGRITDEGMREIYNRLGGVTISGNHGSDETLLFHPDSNLVLVGNPYVFKKHSDHRTKQDIENKSFLYLDKPEGKMSLISRLKSEARALHVINKGSEQTLVSHSEVASFKYGKSQELYFWAGLKCLNSEAGQTLTNAVHRAFNMDNLITLEETSKIGNKKIDEGLAIGISERGFQDLLTKIRNANDPDINPLLKNYFEKHAREKRPQSAIALDGKNWHKNATALEIFAAVTNIIFQHDGVSVATTVNRTADASEIGHFMDRFDASLQFHGHDPHCGPRTVSLDTRTLATQPCTYLSINLPDSPHDPQQELMGGWGQYTGRIVPSWTTAEAQPPENKGFFRRIWDFLTDCCAPSTPTPPAQPFDSPHSSNSSAPPQAANSQFPQVSPVVGVQATTTQPQTTQQTAAPVASTAFATGQKLSTTSSTKQRNLLVASLQTGSGFFAPLAQNSAQNPASAGPQQQPSGQLKQASGDAPKPSTSAVRVQEPQHAQPQQPQSFITSRQPLVAAPTTPNLQQRGNNSHSQPQTNPQAVVKAVPSIQKLQQPTVENQRVQKTSSNEGGFTQLPSLSPNGQPSSGPLQKQNGPKQQQSLPVEQPIISNPQTTPAVYQPRSAQPQQPQSFFPPGQSLVAAHTPQNPIQPSNRPRHGQTKSQQPVTAALVKRTQPFVPLTQPNLRTQPTQQPSQQKTAVLTR